MPTIRKKPEELLADFKFVENLIKNSDEKAIRQELLEKSNVSDEKELNKLSHEVFKIIDSLKKMDEPELLKISGGVKKQDILNEAMEVGYLGKDVFVDISSGNVTGAFEKLIKDNFKQGLRYIGSWIGYRSADNIYQQTVEEGKESRKHTDFINTSKKKLSDEGRNIALAALAIVGSAVVLKMFKKKRKK